MVRPLLAAASILRSTLVGEAAPAAGNTARASMAPLLAHSSAVSAASPAVAAPPSSKGRRGCRRTLRGGTAPQTHGFSFGGGSAVELPRARRRAAPPPPPPPPGARAR